MSINEVLVSLSYLLCYLRRPKKVKKINGQMLAINKVKMMDIYLYLSKNLWVDLGIFGYGLVLCYHSFSFLMFTIGCFLFFYCPSLFPSCLTSFVW
ncbi:hypothetical protein HanRHA438_Chr00c34g0855641 [Helianthus annuus]|nr:hypothetical protein HanHA300_Chr04g0137831 [Helianthus annuus]KAJ0597115.1 hypothetical protein HanHA89_Chr04g0150821 [Helianthus annuus]KAJ0757792.1 hypothetical protein HanLR1_Chr04g0142871 [Helianthus annuus]KAJ0761467.1 hypothetical protein HanOQP8_Chr04g0150191 [Helianthus annuus]KAJ0954011.1 hypothetical protein HanRHA438_Chr00c34g0855641 [Helianthus annuus]